MNNEELVTKNTVYASGFFYYITKSHNIYLYSFIKDLNINGNEYSFLLYLFHNNGSSQSDISKSFKIPKSQVSRSLKKLEEKNLIIRKKDMDNKKVYKVFLTDKSNEIIEELLQAEINWSKMIYSELASNEKEAREILTNLTINALNFTDKMMK